MDKPLALDSYETDNIAELIKNGIDITIERKDDLQKVVVAIVD